MSRAAGRSRLRLRKARKRLPEQLRWDDAPVLTAFGDGAAADEATTTVGAGELGGWVDAGNRKQRRVLAALLRVGEGR